MKHIFQNAADVIRSLRFRTQIHWGIAVSGIGMNEGLEQLDNFTTKLSNLKQTTSLESSEAQVLFGMLMLTAEEGIPNSWADFIETLKHAKEMSKDLSTELFDGNEIENKSLYRIHLACDDLIRAASKTDPKLIKLLDRATGTDAIVGNMLSLLPSDADITIAIKDSVHKFNL